MTEESADKKSGFNWEKSLKVDAYLCMIAGVGIGLLAFAGPLAVWFGFADFRFGFRMLQIVNSYAHWIAGGTFIIAIAIAVIVTAKGLSKSFNLASWR